MGPSKSQSKCSPARVKNCLRTFLAHLFSHIGLCVLIVSYAIVGAALFERLESGYEMEQRDHKSKNWTTTFRQIRQQYVDELWNITEQFNVLYELNWTAAVEQELRNFEAIVALAARRDGYDGGGLRDVERQWSFSGALLYSVSIITTIGYGNTAPRTASGKILTMFYAVIGVPLMLLWLSNIGTLMANTFKFAYSHSCCPSHPNGSDINRSGKAVHKRTGSSKLEPSSTQVKYSVAAMKCETRVIQDHPQHSYPQLHRPSSTHRKQKGALKHLDPAAKQVLLECAEYNLAVNKDERSRRVIQQIQSADSTIDEMSSDDDSVIDISSAGLAAGRDCNLMYERGNNGSAGTSAGIEQGHLRLAEGTPSRIPLLHESGPDLVDVEEVISEEDYCPTSPVRSTASTSQQRVPISLVLIFVVVYILVGATVFSMWEDWNFLESAYFCFITLSTIGLGDYVPGRSLQSDGSKEGHAQLIVCCLYLVLGLAIIAMSFNLVQEEVAAKVKRLAKRIGIIKENSDG